MADPTLKNSKSLHDEKDFSHSFGGEDQGTGRQGIRHCKINWRSEFTPREVTALSLVDRIVMEPHSFDDTLFATLGKYFTDVFTPAVVVENEGGDYR